MGASAILAELDKLEDAIALEMQCARQTYSDRDEYVSQESELGEISIQELCSIFDELQQQQQQQTDPEPLAPAFTDIGLDELLTLDELAEHYRVKYCE